MRFLNERCAPVDLRAGQHWGGGGGVSEHNVPIKTQSGTDGMNAFRDYSCTPAADCIPLKLYAKQDGKKELKIKGKKNRIRRAVLQ